MKIEKGKLYYNIQEGVVEMPMSDMEVDEGVFTNKIAVHCPTKEDWDYVNKKLNHKSEYDKQFNYKLITDDDFSYNEAYCVNHGYHIITIDQFKEFYPPISKEEQDPYVWGSIDISKKTDDNDPINPTHYNQYAIQPLDYIEANGFDFCEGNVIKYVSRYKQKNGLEDLKKARVYLDKLINRYEK